MFFIAVMSVMITKSFVMSHDRRCVIMNDKTNTGLGKTRQ